MTLKALLPEGLKSLPQPLRRALERDDYSTALSLANKAYAEKGAQDKIAPLTYAILLVGRDLVDEAMGVLRRALTYHAQDVSLQLAQVEALMVDTNFEAAMALMEGLRSVSTAEPRHWSFLGDMYLDLGREEDAIDCYERAIEMGSRSVEVAFRLGHLLLDRDELSRAARHFEYAARLAPNNALVWETTADVLLQLGEIEQAIYAYTRVLKFDAHNARTWMYLGLAYQEAETLDKAMEAFERVVALEPENAFAWIQLGHMQMGLGYPEQALQSYRKAAALEPENIDALKGAVGAAFELGDMAEAEQLAHEAVRRKPDEAETHYSLGVVMLALRRPAEALLALTRAVEGDPHQAAFLASLALSELMLGESEPAHVHIHQAVALGVESNSLMAFTEELLKTGSYDQALSFLRDVNNDEPTWRVVVPMLAFLSLGLKRERALLAEQIADFITTLRAQPQVVPVMWDFEELDRLAMRLEAELRKIFVLMIGVVEGRKDLENFESKSNL